MERANTRATSPYEEEFQWRLQESLSQNYGPASEEHDLEWRVAIQNEFWKEDLDIARLFQSEKLTTTDEHHWEQQEL
ncbi:Hypothetical predicted protein [Pelobates cultripes]|uniref:Uncharacterized protein n=1 Tax=Pelobates cultripes TaxID=61616 RepID=A0AAD1WN58_PELCU|nr:Hypothetical predicted protein [Pelobates cultripes]